MSWNYLGFFRRSRSSVSVEEAATTNHGDSCLPIEDMDFTEIWSQCRDYTMTSFARGLALFRAVRHVAENKIPGDFIECGVWRGGSTMIAMLSLKHFGITDKNICIFDTFDGMTEPGSVDVDISGAAASDLINASPDEPSGIICRASIAEVRENLGRIDYPPNLIEYVEGDIRQTLDHFRKRPISILRLDTDFYDSTRKELIELYPTLSENGVLIIDDYGHWRGSRRAVDEYFERLRNFGEIPPMLNIIDYTGRIGVK